MEVLKLIGKLVYAYLKEHPKYIILNIFFILVNIAYYFYLPLYYGELIDDFKNNTQHFIKSVIIILALNVFSYVSFQFEDYYNDLQKIGIREKIRENITNNLQRQYIENPREIVIGEKLTKLLNNQEIIVEWYSNFREYILPYFFTFISTTWYFFTVDYYLPLGMVLLLVSSFFLIFSNIIFCSKYHKITSKKNFDIYTRVEDYLSNIMTIYTYNQIKSEKQEIKKLQDEYLEAFKLSDTCTLYYSLFGSVLMGMFLFLIMYRSYQLLMNNKITKKVFIGLYFVTIGLLGKLIWMSDIFHNISINFHNLDDLADDEKLNEMITRDSRNNNNNNNANIISPEERKSIQSNLIKINGLRFKYPDTEKYIFDNLTINVGVGERVALVGEIGKGKSTLLKIILGLLKPTGGEIYLKGVEYGDYNKYQLFSHFGYMTQNPTLFNRSILENILFGNNKTTRKEVEELLDYFGLWSVFKKFEKGIDTNVGPNGSLLSGGQKQIVWFLRIYLRQPDILLLDEPTASLNTESKERLWKLIEKGFKDKTIIVASHDDFLINKVRRRIKIN
jgi:ABC-type multidrug transport system fused ATPase/permease subunit